ncbi:MAG TPA: hypothetical protein VGW76_16475 [Pyrinomonadaceae bacterium]|nr:hypothetical protein [Pyrinomonadaceae bacterium]
MATKSNVPNAFSFWQAWLYHLIPNLEEVIDPNNPMHQIGLQATIHEMANSISDRAARTEIQGTAKKSIASIASKNVK